MKTIFTYLIPITLIALLGLSNCRKEKNDCEDKEHFVERIHIGDSMRSKVPHTGHDTLVFFNQYGDTVFLTGDGSESFTIEKGYNVKSKGCIAIVHYFIDFKELRYSQDTGLSNTSDPFPIKTILINSDSNSDYKDLTGYWGGVSIPLEKLTPSASYNYLNDLNYTEVINIGNQTYHCAELVNPMIYGAALYYNHYQGIIRLIENDTVIWNRKF